MICEKCKKEILEDSKFCEKCGAKVEIISVPKKQSLWSSIFKNKIVISIVCLGVLILLGISFVGNKISEYEVEELIDSTNINQYYAMTLDIDTVKIISQEKRHGKTYVTCKLTTSNDLVYVEKTCELICYKEKGVWKLDEYEIVSIDEERPKVGAHTDADLLSSTQESDIIKEMYPNIEWIDTDTFLSRGLGSQNHESITDWSNCFEQYSCNYNIHSNTALISGKIEYNYMFAEGRWQLKSINEVDRSYDWDIEGIYTFVVPGTYYYYGALNIESIDWENKKAHCYYYGSFSKEFEGEYIGDCWIDFVKENDQIKFDLIEFKTSMLESANLKFRFTATIEDMYYTYSYQTPASETLGTPIGGVRR